VASTNAPDYVLARERWIAPKSRTVPIAVVNNSIPGPLSGTRLRFAASIDVLVDVDALVDAVDCACATTGKIKAAAARAQTFPMPLRVWGFIMLLIRNFSVQL
jgi:hypothetical protein